MRMLRRMVVWAVAGGVMLALGSAGRGEQGSGSQAGQTTAPGLVPVVPPDARVASMEEDQAKLRNIERQKRLVEDTTKLLKLANELKVDVDKSNKDTLSLDVIRKADEIEKLAHSVKEKMKGN